ncbi:MAG: TIGR02530 family flagellar biosynthesis protein [Anaerovoracaceae bacterium]
MSDIIRNSFSEVNSKRTLPTVREAQLRSQSIGSDFGSLLEEQLNKNRVGNREGVQFSKHAMQRVEQRGIDLNNSFLDRMEEAVSKAREKGSRDCIVIDGNGAFIVNIPNNIVITAVSEDEMKENIFTNIDSAVII